MRIIVCSCSRMRAWRVAISLLMCASLANSASRAEGWTLGTPPTWSLCSSEGCSHGWRLCRFEPRLVGVLFKRRTAGVPSCLKDTVKPEDSLSRPPSTSCSMRTERTCPSSSTQTDLQPMLISRLRPFQARTGKFPLPWASSFCQFCSSGMPLSKGFGPRHSPWDLGIVKVNS
jgi:hypothetical protein